MEKYKPFFESIEIPLEKGDTFLWGKFRNRSAVFDHIEKDEKGQDIIVTEDGKKIPLLKIRLIQEQSKLKEDMFTPFQAWYFPNENKFIKFSLSKDSRDYVDNYEDAMKKGAVRIYAYDSQVEVETKDNPDHHIYSKVINILSKKIYDFKDAIKKINWFYSGHRQVFNLQEDIRITDLMKASMSPFTRKFNKETNKLMGNPTNHSKLVQAKYSKKKDYIDFYWVTERTPKYKDNFNMMVVNPKNWELHKDNLYTIQLRIYGIFDLLKQEKPLSNEDIESALMMLQCKVWSDVPAFHFQGANYNLSLLDGSLFPTEIAPKYWNKFHHSDQFLDKHAAGIFQSIKFYIPQMRQTVKKILKK